MAEKSWQEWEKEESERLATEGEQQTSCEDVEYNKSPEKREQRSTTCNYAYSPVMV